jgi:hypothetical protein
MLKLLKTPILKMELSRIFKNISTCTKCPILQNELHVNEILIFSNFQLSGALKVYTSTFKYFESTFMCPYQKLFYS